MVQQRSWIVAAGSLAALFVVPGVNGHIYIEESRQCYNSAVYQTEDYPFFDHYAGAYNAGNQVEVQKRAIALTDPALLAEYGDGWWPLRWVYEKGEMAPNGNYLEPQGISVRHGVCGDPKSADQGGNEGDNVYSTPNKGWPILQEFTQGGVMEITAVMKAHHWGHLEFFICDAADLADPDGVATQECFNKHPLTRAEGDGENNSPIDPNYPGRYYVDPPCRKDEIEQTFDWNCGGGSQMNMKYQLPEDLACEHCVLQMWYYTGHRCKHPGYDEFNPASWPSECAPNKADWIDVDLPFCGDELWLVCEEFWQCSDLRITAGGSTPLTASSPGASTAEAATAEPVAMATPPPAMVATPEPSAAWTLPPGAAAPPTTSGAGAKYLGCFHDSKDDRVLGDRIDSSEMTTEMCLNHCLSLGAAFTATQFGFECWCSDEVDLDYERHFDLVGVGAVCDMSCQGNTEEFCGGFDAFDLYQFPTCHGDPVEAFEQCGGQHWRGSMCCFDGYECVEMSSIYSECRPSST